MFKEGGATKLIGRLVAKGLVVRKLIEDDRRVVLVAITQTVPVMSDLLESSLSERRRATQ